MVASLGSIASNTPPSLLNALLNTGFGVWLEHAHMREVVQGRRTASADKHAIVEGSKGLSSGLVRRRHHPQLKADEGKPLGVLYGLRSSVTRENGQFLVQRHIDQLFEAICEIRGSLYQLGSLANLARLRVSPLQAEAIYTRASTLFGKSRRDHRRRDGLEPLLDFASRDPARGPCVLIPQLKASPTLPFLVEAIVELNDPGHLYTAIVVMSEITMANTIGRTRPHDTWANGGACYPLMFRSRSRWILPQYDVRSIAVLRRTT